MTDELKPVPCRCGGEAKVYKWGSLPFYKVQCTECVIMTKPCDDVAKAVTAWNRAMGSAGKSSTVERTAKVEHLERRSETFMSWEGICTNCGSYTMHEMNYCFHCGARLEWE